MKYIYSVLLLLFPIALFAQGWNNYGVYQKLNSGLNFNQLVLSEDGKTFFTLSQDTVSKTTYLTKWDNNSGDSIWTRIILLGKPKFGNNFFISSDSKTLISSSDSNIVRLFDIESNSLLATYNWNNLLYRVVVVNSADYFSSKKILKVECTTIETIYSQEPHKQGATYYNGNKIILLDSTSSYNQFLFNDYGFLDAINLDKGIISTSYNYSWQGTYHNPKDGKNFSESGSAKGFKVTKIQPDTKIYESDNMAETSDMAGDTVFIIEKGKYSLYDISKKNFIAVNDLPLAKHYEIRKVQNGNLIIACDNKIYFYDKSDGLPFNTITIDSNSGILSKIYFNSGNNEILAVQGSQVIKVKYINSLKALFSIDRAYHVVNEDVIFRSHSTGSPDSFLWDFGDGQQSTQENPVHQYKNPGHYTVKLTVKKGIATDTENRENVIEIKDKPHAYFISELSSVYIPVELKLINKSTGKIDSVEWTIRKSINGYGDVIKIDTPKIIIKYPCKLYITLKIYSYPYTSEYMDSVDLTKIKEPEIKYSNIIFEKTVPDSSNLTYSEVRQAYETSDGFISLINPYNSLFWFETLSKEFKVQRKKYFTDLPSIYQLENNKFLMFSINKDYYYHTFYDIDTVNFAFNFLKDSMFRKPFINQNDNRFIYPRFGKFYLSGDHLYFFSMANDTLYLIEVDGNRNFKFDYFMKLKQFTNYSSNYCNSLFQSLTFFNNKLYYSLNMIYVVNHQISMTDFESYRDTLQRTNLFSELFNIVDMFSLDNILVVVTGDGKLYGMDKNEKVIWETDKNITLTYAMAAGKKNFIVAGIIDEQPCIFSFNDKGVQLDSVLFEGRYGKFNHISVTYDGNLLFSGYKQFGYSKSYELIGNSITPYYVKIKKDFIHSSDVLPNSDSLISNLSCYPNPGSDLVNIEFNLKEDANISLKIYNSLGGLTKTIYEGSALSGYQEYNFSLKPYSSGSYYYRIKVNDKYYSGSIIIAR